MKHKTALMLVAAAWTLTGPARAQTAPPPPTPPAQPASPEPPTQAPPTSGPQTRPSPEPVPTAGDNVTPPRPPPSAPLPPGAAPIAPAPPVSQDPAAAPPSPVARVAEPPKTSALDTSGSPNPRPLLGLGLAAPDTGALPGRFRPSFGVAPANASDYKFDFHGFLVLPLRLGVNQRAHPTATQYSTVFHGPPVVPDDFDRFEHTGVVPQPWTQLGFSYGNSRAVATVIIAARSVSVASGFFNPPDQLGINDAFITFKPDFGKVNVEVDVGGFANRYGSMGDYDTGRYDTPVIARVGGVGETARVSIPLGGVTFLAEHGVMGQFDRAPLGVEPAGWNDFADSNVGTSLANHAHLGFAVPGHGQFGLHYISAFTRDDRTAPSQPDGVINVFGADANLELAPFGRLYVAGAYTHADDARGVSGVIRVLNTFGGPGLMQNYFGPNSGGNGSLTTFGAQYDVSIGKVVRHPQAYSGYGPDVFASVFGMFTHVTSKQAEFNDIDKLKYGAELTYSALSWLAFSGRYDRVVANTDDASKTFAIVSPRVIFRSDYNSQDQVTLQYSRWMYGSGVVVRDGYPPVDDPSVVPDPDTFSLSASMWW
jgi:hypothetical protein